MMPKLVSGSENWCSFVFDKKYEEFSWFGLAHITAHGVMLQAIRRRPVPDQLA